MTEEEALIKITQLEAAVDELRRARIEDKEWARGEFDSVVQCINANDKDSVRCMMLVTGENGNNGLTSKVKTLEISIGDLQESQRVILAEQQAQATEQRTYNRRFHFLVLALVLGAIVAAAAKVLGLA